MRSMFLTIGAILLGGVGYLSAGDKLSDLAQEWGSAFQSGLVAASLSVPLVRDYIASSFVKKNFGKIACPAESGKIDLDKDGRTTDLVVQLAPAEFDEDCEGGIRPSLAVLKNSGWDWYAVELIEAGSSSAVFQWYNGYIFMSIYGTDFPHFTIFALSEDSIKSIHQDFGELPEPKNMFRYGNSHKFFVSGRDADMLISYDASKKRHVVRRIAHQNNEWSRLHVISSLPGGWSSGYSYDGEKIDMENGRGAIQKYLGELDLVYVPKHCDKKGLVDTPAFPGYSRAKHGAEEIRVCCPIDPEEYGSCDHEVENNTGYEYMVIEIH